MLTLQINQNISWAEGVFQKAIYSYNIFNQTSYILELGVHGSAEGLPSMHKSGFNAKY